MRLPTRLSQRPTDSHKGDFGHVLVIAGSARFSGAAVLSGWAALRSGAGLVTLALPRSINSSIIRIKPPELMTMPLAETKTGSISFSAMKQLNKILPKADVLIIGPGLSNEKSTQALARKLVKINKLKVIDADGLNAIAGHLNVFQNLKTSENNTVITPHPAEMARLIGKSTYELQKDRKTVAKKFSKEYNLTVVLKGSKTIVSDNKGRTYLNRTGNPGMATAGSGDVLSGIIAAFLAQGLKLFDAAKFGVYIHGLAGDLAAKRKTRIGMIASDIIESIPDAVKASL